MQQNNYITMNENKFK